MNQSNRATKKATPKHPALVMMERFKQAEAEGRAASFEYSNGTITKAWIGKQPKRLQGRCGATTRQGTPCAMRTVPGRKRCRLHGGLSTGPKTEAGRARIAASNRSRAQCGDVL